MLKMEIYKIVERLVSVSHGLLCKVNARKPNRRTDKLFLCLFQTGLYDHTIKVIKLSESKF